MKAIRLLPALLSSLAGTIRHGALATASPSTLSPLATVLLVLPAATTRVAAQEELDDNPDCQGWADAGECAYNPQYMLNHCPIACKRQEEHDRQMMELIDEKIGHINSFFELEAEDIDKKLVKFDRFRGKVTVITNVASYCGYTESHYNGLVQLYDRFKSAAVGFDILAFPCNQFGEQEPETCPKIKRFAQKKGVEFTMMNKVDVNGVDAHPVYHYLKKIAGPPQITWNFASYYVVTPEGTVASFNGVEPLDLVKPVMEAMMGTDESSSSDDEGEGEGEL